MNSSPASPAAPRLAIIVPCFNEEAVLAAAASRLQAQLTTMRADGRIDSESFLCFVDDGSTDNTWPTIRRLIDSAPNVRGLKLARNFGHQNALLAGLNLVRDRCDCAVTIDADLQQDVAAIGAFIQAFENGHDVVFGVRRSRATDSSLKRLTARTFYRLMGMLGVNIVSDHADFRLLSRKALDALAQFGEGNIFLRGLVAQLGFRSATVTFDVSPRPAGQSKYSLFRMISFALNGITAFSIAPLRIIAVLGAIFTIFAMGMASYVLLEKLLVGGTVPGWASTVLPIYILGGIQLLAIGVIGEYVGRIYMETKRRPRYLVDVDLTGPAIKSGPPGSARIRHSNGPREAN